MPYLKTYMGLCWSRRQGWSKQDVLKTNNYKEESDLLTFISLAGIRETISKRNLMFVVNQEAPSTDGMRCFFYIFTLL